LKKLITICYTFIFITILFVQNVNADATKTVGASGADYATLKLAFDAINAGTLTGAVTLQIIDNTTETATATLNASGSGSASYTSVNIYPTASGLKISGAVSYLITLNGANNVTIDGRVNATGSTKDLIIESTASNSPALRYSSASYNTIKYTILKSKAYTYGTIYMVYSSGTSGSSNNLIDYCDFTNSEGTRPAAGIRSTGDAAYLNTYNTVSNCNFYDFINLSLGPGYTSMAIFLSSNNNEWTITNNSIYETAGNIIPSTTTTIEARLIVIQGAVGNNFTITNNYLGGTQPLCGGGHLTKTNAKDNKFCAMYLSYGIYTISGNTIANIDWSNSTKAEFYGIYYNSSGTINFSNNTIGATTGTGSITVTNSSADGTTYGVYIFSSGAIDIESNNIGSVIVATGSTSYSHTFNGIYTGSSGTMTISNNLIGSTSTTNSIQASSSSTSATAQNVYGINSGGTGSVTIANNTIANMYNAYAYTSATSDGQVVGILTRNGVNTIQNNTVRNLSTTSPNTDATNAASVIGISQRSTSTSGSQTVSGNTIYYLANAYSGSNAVGVIGLYYSGPASGTNSVSKNFIHSLSISSTSTSSIISGIKINAGATTYSNNIINLGGGVSTGYSIYGIYENGASGNNNNLYFNTIYVDGTPSGTTSSTYALYNAVNTNTRDFRNNILYNARSGGTTGKHYAVSIAGTTGLTINYNDYYASGTSGVLGYLGADKTTLSDWQTATGQDANSLNTNPNLTNAGSTTATDYRLTINHTGVDGTGITDDYSGYSRSGTPTIGAIEYDNPVPVELASFSANAVNSKVILNWSTATEVNNYGFSVERSEASLNNPEAGASSYIWETIGFVQGHGNSNSPKEYSFTDNNLQQGNIRYRLKQIDNDGQYEYSDVVEVAFNLSPSTFELFQNYPNPFNPSTTIRYSIPQKSKVILKVFDVLGTEVTTLVNEEKSAGNYEIKFEGNGLVSGIYFYRITNGINSETRKMILLR